MSDFKKNKLKKLLVIIPDRLSEIISKGELQPRYYNPGNVFDEVHILLCNDDMPDNEPLKYLVGDAELFIHNYSDNLNLVGKTPEFLTKIRLRRWAKGGIEIAKKISPDLIRCHGADWNLYLASRIKAKLNIPYIVSLHINPDVNPVRRHIKEELTVEEKRHNRFYDYIEKTGLLNADLVMPVYKPIVPYLHRVGVKNIKVCYNVLNSLYLKEKTDYSLHSPVNIIYVGRLIEEKYPENIIRAVARLPNTCFTIVGDGPCRVNLEKLVSDLGVKKQVNFVPSIENNELCGLLVEQDIFAVHTEYFEINKSVLEALLTGMPVIINHRKGTPVPELEGDFVYKVNNTEDDYFYAIKDLINDNEKRSELGVKAFRHSRRNWDPVITEQEYVDIYKQYMRKQ